MESLYHASRNVAQSKRWWRPVRLGMKLRIVETKRDLSKWCFGFCFSQTCRVILNEQLKHHCLRNTKTKIEDKYQIEGDRLQFIAKTCIWKAVPLQVIISLSKTRHPSRNCAWFIPWMYQWAQYPATIPLNSQASISFILPHGT